MEPADKKNQFVLRDMLALIKRRKWLLILPFVIVTATAFVFSYSVTPIYESTAIVMIDDQVRVSRDLQHFVGDFQPAIGGSRDRWLEQQSLLNEIISAPYIEQLIQKLELDKNRRLVEKARQQQVSHPNMSIDEIKLAILLKTVRENVKVAIEGRNQVRISAQYPDPKLARDLARNLGEILIAEKKREYMGSVGLSSDFAYEQLAKYETDLEELINERSELEKSYMETQQSHQGTPDPSIDHITSEILETNLEINEREREEREVLLKLDSIPRRSLVLSESTDLRSKKEGIKTLIESMTTLMCEYTWSDPVMMKYESRLVAAENEIEEEIGLLVKQQFASNHNDRVRVQLMQLFGAQTFLSILYDKLRNLELILADLNRQKNLTSEQQIQLEQLDRKIIAARELRDRFRMEQKSSEISMALLQRFQCKVVEPASIPLHSIWPNKKKLILIGMIFGLVLGGGIIFLVELLNTSFRKVEEVEEYLGLPVLSVIPKIERLEKLH
jgi:succinoglycan biosynthesis transport protein ExoP